LFDGWTVQFGLWIVVFTMMPARLVLGLTAHCGWPWLPRVGALWQTG
jgi:hypothetical protein